MAQVLVPLADGFEELEAVTLTDLLTRAGVHVITAGLHPGAIQASRGLSVNPTTTLDQVLNQDFDLIVLPGGLPGADNLNASPELHQLILCHVQQNKPIAAICAAPRVLADAGLLKQRNVTSFPGALSGFGDDDFANTGSALESDGNIITSRGPGTAMVLALHLIELLCGKDQRDQVAAQMVQD